MDLNCEILSAHVIDIENNTRAALFAHVSIIMQKIPNP